MSNTNRMPLSPKAVAGIVLLLNAAFISFAIFRGVQGGNPARHFDEGTMGTWFSVVQLLAIGALAFVTMRIRKSYIPWTGWRTPWLIWALLGAGFLFLAADDGLKIHERLDGILHKIFHLKESALTDRLDDAIIGSYGILGLIALYVYRKELAHFKPVLPILGAAFVIAFLQVALDMLGNRKDFLEQFFTARKAVRNAHHWLETAEGSVQLLAEGVFVVAFWTAACVANSLRGAVVAPELAKPAPATAHLPE